MGACLLILTCGLLGCLPGMPAACTRCSRDAARIRSRGVQPVLPLLLPTLLFLHNVDECRTGARCVSTSGAGPGQPFLTECPWLRIMKPSATNVPGRSFLQMPVRRSSAHQLLLELLPADSTAR